MNDAETSEFLSLLRGIKESLDDLNEKIDDISSWKEDSELLLDHMDMVNKKLNETFDTIQEQYDELNQIKDLMAHFVSGLQAIYK